MRVNDSEFVAAGMERVAISTPQTTNEKPAVVNSGRLTDDEQQLRELAVKQIERKRRFQMRAFSATAVSVLLVVIWAITEYNNAGGWPTNGFSQSSGIPHEWNNWIIYPVIAVGLAIAVDAWKTYRRKPISEGEIRREMDRLTGAR
jgi:2TM domain